jgi:hypothetical protein
MTRGELAERTDHGEKSGDDRAKPALQTARLADANQHQDQKLKSLLRSSGRFRMFECPRRYTRRMPPVS